MSGDTGKVAGVKNRTNSYKHTNVHLRGLTSPTKEVMKKKPTIAELEAILNGPEQDIQILPNGEIRKRRGRKKKEKPLTYQQNLGGEYGNGRI